MNILLFLDVFWEKNQLEVLCLYPLRNFSMHITFNKGSANTGYSVLAPLYVKSWIFKSKPGHLQHASTGTVAP